MRGTMRISIKVVVLGFALALSVVSHAVADLYADGLAAFQRADYPTALKLWRELADKGDVRAQGSLGTMYDNGIGVPQDYSEGVRWHRKAAEQGSALDQTILGMRYADGEGVAQDLALSAEWNRKAAYQGEGAAQVQLGTAYARGRGVKQDFVQAMKWWLIAAQGNEPPVVTASKTLINAVGPKLTKAQLDEAKKLAGEWKPTMMTNGTLP